MPTDIKVLHRLIGELSSLIADMIAILPEKEAEEYREKYLMIIGEKK